MAPALKELMLLAICKPENRRKVPYAKMSNGKDNLHYWETDQHKSAEECANIAERYALEQQIKLLKKIEDGCPTMPDAYHMVINYRVELEKQLNQ